MTRKRKKPTVNENEQIPQNEETTENQQLETSEQTGRIVIITGDKGGVGKSTFALVSRSFRHWEPVMFGMVALYN